MNVSGFAFSEAQAGEGGFNFNRVAEGCPRNYRQFFALEQAQLQEALRQSRGASDRRDPAPRARRNLIEGRHLGASCRRSNRPDEDLCRRITTQTELASADLKQA